MFLRSAVRPKPSFHGRWIVVLSLAACTDGSVDSVDSVDTKDSPAADEPECDEAEARLGFRACVPRIPDDDTFNGVTVAASTVDELRTGKYLVPAVEEARLPGLFVDVNAFLLHFDFLAEAFPDRFPALTNEEYQSMVLYPETREMYAGTISLYINDEGAFYGFTVWDDPNDESTTVTEAQITDVWTQLTARFDVGALVFVPNSTNQMTEAATWSDTPFEVENPADVDYEAYNPGEAYGYLRLYTADEFVAADEDSAYGYQDILVIDEAPEDLTRVVSGIVTGTRQGALSHLSVRSAARGTPNCYVKDPLEVLAEWGDELVRFECGEDGWSAELATVTDANAWWSSIRPEPVEVCTPDFSSDTLMPLLELPTDSAEERAANVCRYGAKGSNLATLYQRIPDEFQLDGFLIPVSAYQDFVTTGTWTVDLGAGEAVYTFQETIDAWHEDDLFLTDASVRRERLDALQAAFYEAPIDPDLLDALAAQMLETYGSDLVMARFRSSSNAEDSLEFSGAGLYESGSGCLADELDGDEVGPSWCDPDETEERTVSAALQEVWGSLWKMAAWEERDWYSIDHADVAMGVLSDTRLKDEQSNIVAFSGNPSDISDARYLFNAQVGDLDVVSAEAGVWPEKILATVEDGAVTLIDRVSTSSEVDEVLSDEQVEWLGATFADIVAVYPMDHVAPDDHDIVWDTEWKFDEGGQLIVKQIRPYLR